MPAPRIQTLVALEDAAAGKVAVLVQTPGALPILQCRVRVEAPNGFAALLKWRPIKGGEPLTALNYAVRISGVGLPVGQNGAYDWDVIPENCELVALAAPGGGSFSLAVSAIW